MVDLEWLYESFVNYKQYMKTIADICAFVDLYNCKGTL